MAIIYKINGKQLSREDFMRDAKGVRAGEAPMVNGAFTEHKPLTSYALSVAPHQAKQMREKVKGIPGVQVHNNGTVAFTSRAGRRETMKRCGFHDRSGGYGDQT